MDAVEGGAYAEWREHPATKLLLGQLKEDCTTIKQEIVARAQSRLLPDVLEMASLGLQLSASEGLLDVAMERSNG
jgi:hypothetical protein